MWFLILEAVFFVQLLCQQIDERHSYCVKNVARIYPHNMLINGKFHSAVFPVVHLLHTSTSQDPD